MMGSISMTTNLNLVHLSGMRIFSISKLPTMIEEYKWVGLLYKCKLGRNYECEGVGEGINDLNINLNLM